MIPKILSSSNVENNETMNYALNVMRFNLLWKQGYTGEGIKIGVDRTAVADIIAGIQRWRKLSTEQAYAQDRDPDRMAEAERRTSERIGQLPRHQRPHHQ